MIVSPPRCGKTTLLRDMIRLVSNGYEDLPGQTVGVVDERSELAGCWQGIPQNDLGMRTDILDGCPKAEGMQMLLRSMSPAVVAVDELGRGRRITVRWNPWCAADASFWPQPTEALSRISWSSPFFRSLPGSGFLSAMSFLGKTSGQVLWREFSTGTESHVSDSGDWDDRVRERGFGFCAVPGMRRKTSKNTGNDPAVCNAAPRGDGDGLRFAPGSVSAYQ